MSTHLEDNTLSAALGIKGRAKLRPHPKSQLPHIELRRVDPPADASDTSGATLYFSFFSAKPLNCKAGRELLLSLGRIDDRHEGRSIMLEGVRCLPGDDDDQPVLPPTAEVPLKFRKARWGGIVDALPSTQATYAEAGIQAEPSCSDASIQVQPHTLSVSIQAQKCTFSQATQWSSSHLPRENQTTSSAESQARDPSLSHSFSPALSLVEISQLSPEARKRDFSNIIDLTTSPLSPLSAFDGVEGFSDEMDISPSDSPVLSSPNSTRNFLRDRSYDASFKGVSQQNVPDSCMSAHSELTPVVKIDKTMKIALENTIQPPPNMAKSKHSVNNAFVSAGFVSDFVDINSRGVDANKPIILLKTDEVTEIQKIKESNASFFSSTACSISAPHAAKETLQPSREAKVAPYTSWDTDPPGPKSKIPLPVEASFNNPLGIRPSKVSRNARFTPTGPKALQSISTPEASTSKKKLVIGSTWTLGKANSTLDKAASWPESERAVPCSAKRKDKPPLPPLITNPPSPPRHHASQPVLAPPPQIRPLKASPLMTLKSPDAIKIDGSKWKKISEIRPAASSSTATNAQTESSSLSPSTSKVKPEIQSPSIPEPKFSLEGRTTEGPIRPSNSPTVATASSTKPFPNIPARSCTPTPTDSRHSLPEKPKNPQGTLSCKRDRSPSPDRRTKKKRKRNRNRNRPSEQPSQRWQAPRSPPEPWPRLTY